MHNPEVKNLKNRENLYYFKLGKDVLDSTANALCVEAKPKPSFFAGLWVSSLTSSRPIIHPDSREVKALDEKPSSVRYAALTAHCTHLHRTSGTGRGSAIHCPGPQHRRHRQVRTAGGCPTLAAPSPQPETDHTLMTPVFLGADQGFQDLPRTAAPHPHVLKVIPSPETTLSVERATAVFSSGFQAPVFSAVLSPGLWNRLTALFGMDLLYLAGVPFSASTSQAAGSHPPTDLWSHSFLFHVSQTLEFLGSSDCS